MVIAFTGTHVTGKTTLLNDYLHYTSSINHRRTVGYITGIARSIIDRGFPLNKDGNVYSYINYVNDQLNAEKAINQYDDFICDRTLLSPLAYSSVNRSLPRPYIPDYLIEMIENVWLLERSRIDLYAYFPIEFDMVAKDDIHPSDEKYRRQIDEMIYSLLLRHNVNFVVIAGTREERLNKLISLFENGAVKKFL